MKDIAQIVKFTKNLWPWYGVIAVLTMIVAGLSQVSPFLIRRVVVLLEDYAGQELVREDAIQTLLVLVGLLLAVELANTFIANISGYFSDVMSAKLKRLLSERYYDHLLALPQGYFDNELTGKIIARLNRTIESLGTFFKQFSGTFVQLILTALVTLCVIAIYSWPIALAIGLLFPLYFWFTKRSSDVWKETQGKINEHVDVAQGRFGEVISQIRVAKSYVQEKTEFLFFRRQYQGIIDATKEQSSRWHRYDIYRRAALNIVLAGSYGYISWQALNGQLSLPDFVLLMQLISQVQFPLFTSSFIMDAVQQAQSNSKDYFEVMNLEPAISDKPGAKKLKVTQADVRYDEVGFSYIQDQPVLQGISFRIAPGKKLALVGASGGGKSTIANLLMRLYEPQSGLITIDDQDITAVKQRSLRDVVSVVFQDASLFSGTVRENIAYGRPKARQKDIEKAAKAANAHGFIQELADGYDTELGERGLKLSGGQKQRIAIARAILKDAPILILDEATSALDSKSEAEVQRALDALMKGRTTLIIAHRLSTIKDADTIVVLDHGKIAEMGSPSELAESGGIYAELLELQDPRARNRKARLKKFDFVAR